MSVILGIDPGSLTTGFGLVRCTQSGIYHLAHGTAILAANKSLAERLGDLAHDLNTIIDQYSPERVAVEDIFVLKNARSALILGQARGAVLAVMGLRKIPVIALSPTAVKSRLTGNGRAKKFQVAHMVALRLGIPLPKSEDASDALALAIALAS